MPEHKFVVYSSCRFVGGGIDKIGDLATCKQLFDYAVDPKNWGCGPMGGSGTLTLRLKDGRSFVRDLSADRCSVAISGLPAHKGMYAMWYSVGGK